MDRLDLLAVQGTLKSLLQHHSSKPSILQCSAFFTVQLSHPYMTTGKTIALTRRTFLDKVMSLLFNMLSRLVITFLPRSKHLLISRLQSPSAVILEPQKIKSDTVSTVSPSICHEVIGPDAMILVFWIKWPKYWSFSFSISPSNEYSGLISFRMDWLDLLAVQGTLKSLLQHHSSKASILQSSTFFIVQLLHPYMTTRKTTGLTRGTFVSKVMSLFFHMLFILVRAFLSVRSVF